MVVRRGVLMLMERDEVSASDHLNPQQFYHGTSDKFAPGDELTDGYSTTSMQGASYYASLKAHDRGRKFGHVYAVQPSEDVSPDTSDPDVSDQYKSSRLTVVRKMFSVERGRFE
jgi:hypothetical protein